MKYDIEIFLSSFLQLTAITEALPKLSTRTIPAASGSSSGSPSTRNTYWWWPCVSGTWTNQQPSGCRCIGSEVMSQSLKSPTSLTDLSSGLAWQSGIFKDICADFRGQTTCTLLAHLRKCLIMNGAGEGNRTLISETGQSREKPQFWGGSGALGKPYPTPKGPSWAQKCLFVGQPRRDTV